MLLKLMAVKMADYPSFQSKEINYFNGHFRLSENCDSWVETFVALLKYSGNVGNAPYFLFEPRREKTGFLHLRKQRRRSASR